MKKFFTLIAVAFMAVVAQANVLTVCDGTATNYLVPINGWYVDEEGTMSQMIYPAEMLTEMQNGKISQLKFYPEETIEFDWCELELSFMTVDQNGFETTTAVTGATAVSRMDAIYGSTELVFNLYTPYEYTGGNLLVEVKVTEAGDYNWESTYFLGVETENNASYSHYMSYGTPSDKLHKFLPKATFTYEAGTTPVEPTEACAKPEGNFVNGQDFHGVTVTLINNETAEGTELHYNITKDGELIVEDAIYDEPFALTEDGEYYIDFWATAPGMLDSSHAGLIFTIDPFTGLSELLEGKTVAGVRYFNLAGQEMQQAEGLTIVVTTYTDGTSSAVKVMK